ncbi:hypothetical protein V6Z11_D04G108600 [Gossypium hirsutum]
MSTEAAKRSTTGALTVKQRKTDELKPSPVLTAEPKKVIIKSADMKDDMQKEAVNIALFLYLTRFLIFMAFLLELVSGFSSFDLDLLVNTVNLLTWSGFSF